MFGLGVPRSNPTLLLASLDSVSNVEKTHFFLFLGVKSSAILVTEWVYYSDNYFGTMPSNFSPHIVSPVLDKFATTGSNE